ncbi:MAG TPA: hypothetical protein VJL81_01285 [Solirubrobacterales bacterium]|nr:hypothetical protein [Solirubrobacterales bacterium]
MRIKSRPRWLMALCCVTALAGIQAASASAHTGEFAKFNFCPSTTTGVVKCINSVTTGGEVVLGTKKVPIVNPVTIQGGLSKATGGNRTFFAATNGITLSKTPQPVPGGLLGIVPPEKSPPLVKALSAFFFENALTGVNSTLELAKPASEIVLNEVNLALEEGVALKLPVKVHLENPFLGSKCFVGSESSPLIWNLTTGTTTPPKGTEAIKGFGGEAEFIEEETLLKIKNSKLVENNWSAPTASGCGGILSFLVNPIINSMIGLPSAAGKNKSELITTSYLATTTSVNNH